MTAREANQTVWFIGWAHAWYLGAPYHAYGGPGKTKCGIDTWDPHKRHISRFRRAIAELIGRPCRRCYP